MSEETHAPEEDRAHARAEELRQTILDQYSAEQDAAFEKRVRHNPALGIQLILDPLETLSTFGLIRTETKDLTMSIIEGSFADVLQLRKAVEHYGLHRLLASRQEAPGIPGSKITIALRARGGIPVGPFCFRVCWRSICIIICITIIIG